MTKIAFMGPNSRTPSFFRSLIANPNLTTKIVQKKHGWVPDGAIAEIGRAIGIPAADVEGVATFYNLIFRRPVGRNVIKICDSISCYLTGYDEVRNAISAHLRINLGQTTPLQICHTNLV